MSLVTRRLLSDFPHGLSHLCLWKVFPNYIISKITFQFSGQLVSLKKLTKPRTCSVHICWIKLQLTRSLSPAQWFNGCTGVGFLWVLWFALNLKTCKMGELSIGEYLSWVMDRPSVHGVSQDAGMGSSSPWPKTQDKRFGRWIDGPTTANRISVRLQHWYNILKRQITL